MTMTVPADLETALSQRSHLHTRLGGILRYTLVAFVALAVIGAAATSPGTSRDDFTSMIVFP